MRTNKNILMVFAMLFTAMVNSAVTLTYETKSVVMGTAQVAIQVTVAATAGENVAGLGLNTLYDNTNLTFTGCQTPLSVSICAQNATTPNLINIAQLSAGIPAGGVVAVLLFNTSGNGVGGPYAISAQTSAAPKRPSWTSGAATPVTSLIPAADITDGSITITAGPPPTFASNPAVGNLTFANKLVGDAAETITVNVSNSAANGSTLTGNCSVINTVGTAFSMPTDPVALNLLSTDPAVPLAVTCATGTAGNFTGNLVCTTNDGNVAGTTATYPLACNVATPSPNYASTPAPAPAAGSSINMGSTVAGSGNLTTNLVISNNAGDPGTMLNTACTLGGANPGQFTIAGVTPTVTNAAIPVGTPLTDAIVCTDPGAGLAANTTYTATLSCTENDLNFMGPATYDLTCAYSKAGDGVFSSTPAAGAIDLTNGTPVVSGPGVTVPTTDIVFLNTAMLSTDKDVKLIACGFAAGGSANITATPDLSGTLIPQNSSAGAVSLGCNATAVVAAPTTYSSTYECTYSLDGSNTVAGTASFPTSCSVRAAASAGSPANGTMTAASITAPPGGSTTNTVVTFAETNNEGVNITNLDCALTTGTDFAIVTPTFPATIPAGGSIGVDVSFTDPGVAGPYTDTLTCSYTDSSAALATVTVNLTGTVRAIIVPALSWIGYAALMLGLLFVGFVGFRRRA